MRSTNSPLQFIDLTHPFDSDTIYWPTESGFKLEQEFHGQTEKGYFYAANKFFAPEHGGTHLDAPFHFAQQGQTVEQIPLQHLIGPAILIDATKQTAQNPDYQISVDDIAAWEAKHGEIPPGSIVLLKTGWGKYWPKRLPYLGTEATGKEAVAQLHFPGLQPEAAQWLSEQRRIHAVGIDTASIDYGQSTRFESHRMLFAKNIPAFENLANLNQLPESGFTVIALPMLIKGGSGAPLRIVATVP